MRHMRNTGHLDLERYGNQLLYLFSSSTGPLRNDLDVIVGDVGIGLHG